MGVRDIRHVGMPGGVEDRSGQHQDGAVHEQRQVERHGGVYNIVDTTVAPMMPMAI